MEKFEIDIKWGGYFLVINILTSISIAVLMCLIDFHSLRYLADLLIPVFIVQLLYFTSKAIRENKENGLSKGFRKFFVFIRLLVFYIFLMSFFNTNYGNTVWSPSLLITYRKKNLSDYLVEDNANEENEMTLKELLFVLKRKLRQVNQS